MQNKNDAKAQQDVLAQAIGLRKERNNNLKEQRWREGNLKWKLHAAQRIIYKTIRNLPPDVKEAVCLCARRFGKSYLGVLCAIEDCLRGPGVYVRILGPEISQTINIVEPLIDKICRDAPPGLIKRKASEHRWKVGDSWLVIGGFDNTNIKKHLGQEAYAFYIEETGSAKADDYTYAQREVLSPQLLHSRGKRIHLTTPPDDPSHPFVTENIPKAILNNVFFKYTIYDNPLLDNAQIKEAIEESGGVDTEAWRRNYLCEIIKNTQLTIVPEFDKKLHVKEFDPPAYAYMITAFDLGGIRDKSAGLIMYYDFLEGVDCVFDERICDINTSSRVIFENFKQMELELPYPFNQQPPERFGDSTGLTQVDGINEYGYAFSRPTKMDLDGAVNFVRKRLKEGKLRIHPRCKFLILSLDSGMYNKNRTDFERTETLGHWDAGMALVYGMRMLDRVKNPYPSKVINYKAQIPGSYGPQVTQLGGVADSIFGNTKKFGKYR